MIIICICFSSPARLIRRVNIQKRIIKVFPLKNNLFDVEKNLSRKVYFFSNKTKTKKQISCTTATSSTSLEGRMVPTPPSEDTNPPGARTLAPPSPSRHGASAGLRRSSAPRAPLKEAVYDLHTLSYVYTVDIYTIELDNPMPRSICSARSHLSDFVKEKSLTNHY